MENNRIDNTITLDGDYRIALLDNSEYLFINLIDEMKKEKRYLGIVKAYFNSMRTAYDLRENPSEDEWIIYDKVFFLVRPLIIKEVSRLTKTRGLSEADACITILKKLYEVILDDTTESYKYQAQTRTLLKVITKLWDHIRTPGKKDTLRSFTRQLKEFIKGGYVGKKEASSLTLNLKEEPKLILPREGIDLEIDLGQPAIDELDIV